MTIRSTVVSARFAGILAIALTAMAATSMQASALESCPGGGTRKCTFKCTGPVTKPVCTEVPPCTCTLGGNKTQGVKAATIQNTNAGPLINRPTISRPTGGSLRFR